MDTHTAQALVRFGLGRRGAQALPTDPAAWLAGQLDGPDPALAIPGPSSAEGMVAFREDRKERQERKLEGAVPAGTPPDQVPHRVRDMVRADFAPLVDYVLTTDAPFRERLVWFWANHFTVSLRRGEVSSLVIYPFVREAIRPHVNGRFADMLARGHAASGDADVPRQPGLDRAGQPGRAEEPAAGAEREPRARVRSSCTR